MNLTGQATERHARLPQTHSGGVAYLAELQELFHGDLRLVIAAYAAGERPVLARGLDYSSEEVYAYVLRIGQQYRAELRRTGGK